MAGYRKGDLIEILYSFMQYATDECKMLMEQGSPEEQGNRLTHNGLLSSIIQCWLKATETVYKIPEETRARFHLDAGLETAIIERIIDPSAYHPAFNALEKTDREYFIPWRTREAFIQDFLQEHKSSSVNRDTAEQMIASPYTEEDASIGMVRPLPYINGALPLGNRQSCSAPYIVFIYGLLAKALCLQPRIIGEGGSGCFYHAAFTANLFPDAHIYTWEVPKNVIKRNALAIMDSTRNTNLGERVTGIERNCFSANAFEGLPDSFDMFYFTFEVPDEAMLQPYFSRLSGSGILIAPMPSPAGNVMLRVYQKNGELRHTEAAPVMFQKAVLGD